ncbi:D-aminoacylase [Candidatus Bathyarchaeota archaeon]|nr:D-aminoacylase [Candidatus Bathyarchaeota archaeon]
MVYDFLIKDGMIVDGTGNPWFKGDVAIKDGKIVDVGKVQGDAERTIDAEGLVVSPGFIDIHNHSDVSLLVNPRAESLVRQGVTTVCIGNCGLSPHPVNESTKDDLYRYLSPFYPIEEIKWRSTREFLGKLETKGVSCNVAALVGHGSVRIAVMGFEDREPTAQELREMKNLVSKAMDEGAFGISTGLGYAPGLFSKTDELIELAKVVSRKGGFYATHTRSLGVTYEEGVAEAIEIGRESRIPVQISHIESHYPNWGRTKNVLKMIDEARSQGIDVTCDIPPYLYNLTVITTLLPRWVQEGGLTKLIERLKDRAVREEVKREILKETDKRRSNTMTALAVDGYWDKIRLASSDRNPQFIGRSIADIAEELGIHPYDAVFDLIVEEGKQFLIVGESHHEGDMQLVLKHPASMVETDESARAPYGPLSKGRPHPRAYGTFPLLFRKYVRGENRLEIPEEKGYRLLTLEEAVKKVTSLPAQRLGLQDRGLICKGMSADITVFDPEKVTDEATYSEPHRYPTGVRYVIVNGEIVVEEEEHTGALPGIVLKGSSYHENDR